MKSLKLAMKMHDVHELQIILGGKEEGKLKKAMQLKADKEMLANMDGMGQLKQAMLKKQMGM